MARAKLFVRRRDDRIEVRISPAGRETIRGWVTTLIESDRDSSNPWHDAQQAPINVEADHDDPLMLWERQKLTATSAELTLLTIDETFLSHDEAWAWMSTLQNCLRNSVVSLGIVNDDALAAADPELLGPVRDLQYLLFEIARALK